MSKKSKYLVLIIALMIIGLITIIYRKPIPHARIIFVIEIALLIGVCWKYGKICPKCGGHLVEKNRIATNTVSYVKYESTGSLSDCDQKHPVTYIRTDYDVTYVCNKCGYEEQKHERKEKKA